MNRMEIKDLIPRRGVDTLRVDDSDELVVMDHGKVDMTGTTAEIFRRPDELAAVGLDVPQITRLINILKSSGADLPDDIFTVGRAAEVLTEKLRERGY